MRLTPHATAKNCSKPSASVFRRLTSPTFLVPARKLGDDDARVKDRINRIHAYVKTDAVPSPFILKMAKIGVVLDDWMQSLDITASAIQCWDSCRRTMALMCVR
jgi:L-fucose isomerase-like protein